MCARKMLRRQLVTFAVHQPVYIYIWGPPAILHLHLRVASQFTCTSYFFMGAHRLRVRPVSARHCNLDGRTGTVLERAPVLGPVL